MRRESGHEFRIIIKGLLFAYLDRMDLHAVHTIIRIQAAQCAEGVQRLEWRLVVFERPRGWTWPAVRLPRFHRSAMTVSDSSQAWLSPRVAKRRGVHQSRQPHSQTEPAVEVVSGRCEVASGMLAFFDGVIAPPIRRRLTLAWDRLAQRTSGALRAARRPALTTTPYACGRYPYGARSKPVRRGTPRLLAAGAVAPAAKEALSKGTHWFQDRIARVVQCCVGLNGLANACSPRAPESVLHRLRPPLRHTSSNCTRGRKRGDASRSAIACVTLCLTGYAGRVPMTHPFQYRRVCPDRRRQIRGPCPYHQGSGMP